MLSCITKSNKIIIKFVKHTKSFLSAAVNTMMGLK